MGLRKVEREMEKLVDTGNHRDGVLKDTLAERKALRDRVGVLEGELAETRTELASVTSTRDALQKTSNAAHAAYAMQLGSQPDTPVSNGSNT